MKTIWSAPGYPQLTLVSDGVQFIAQLRDGKTNASLSVGYTSGRAVKVTPALAAQIALVLDAEWRAMKKLPLEKMLPGLFRLARTANRVYNNLMFDQRRA
jgi:hypothetical protein